MSCGGHSSRRGASLEPGAERVKKMQMPVLSMVKDSPISCQYSHVWCALIRPTTDDVTNISLFDSYRVRA